MKIADTLTSFFSTVALADYLPHRIFIKDTESVFVYCNANFASCFGLTPKEIVGRDDSIMSSPKMCEKFRREDLSVLESGEAVTTIEADTVAGTRTWTRTVKKPLRDNGGEIIGLLAHIEDVSKAEIADIEARRSRDALKREKELQRLVAEIAARFISVDAITLDATIGETLAELGTFLGVDRADLFRHSNDGETVSCTHEWCRKGVQPKQPLMQEFSIRSFPWYARMLLEEKKVVHIPDVSTLPPEANAERQAMQNAGVVSAVSIPVYTDVAVYGFLRFVMVHSAYRWTDSEIQDLRVVAQILASTFETLNTRSALERSESLLRETERIAEVGSWDARWNDDPATVHWSAETYRILELRPAETDPSFEAFLAVVHPDDRDAVRNEYRDATENGRKLDILCRLCPTSGITKHARVLGLNEYDENGEAVRSVGVIQDMTRITRLERELVERNEALESSITATAIAGPAGSLTYVNKAFLDLWGVDSRNEVIGTNVFQFHPDKDKARSILDAIFTNGSWKGEVIAQRRDGTAFTALASASVVRSGDGTVRSMIAGFIDITKRKEIERLAQSHADKFRALVNSTMEGYWVINEHGRFTEVNDVACRMLGYTPDEMLRLTIPDIEAVETPEETAAHIRQLKESGYDRFVTQHIRKDGTVIEVEVSATYYPTDKDAVLFAFVQDITDRKRAETAETARAVAERSSRSKSLFLANITHELRTPMNAIMGFAQILQMDQELTVGQSDAIREILDASDNLLSLINRILDLSRIENGEVALQTQSVNCLSAVKDSIAAVTPLAEKSDISFNVSVEEEEFFARADEERLQQVFVNLLSNAVQYNRPGGNVTVRITSAPDFIHVAVEDTGYGIPVEQHPDLFTSFNRVGREAGNIPGTGIGLVYSKRLIEMMGGSIGFETTPEVGSVFWVEIPSA